MESNIKPSTKTSNNAPLENKTARSYQHLQLIRENLRKEAENVIRQMK